MLYTEQNISVQLTLHRETLAMDEKSIEETAFHVSTGEKKLF